MSTVTQQALEDARKRCVTLGIFKPQSLQTYAEYERTMEVLRDILAVALETQGQQDSPLIALLKAWPEEARLTLGNRLLHYRQGAFIVFEQRRGLERIIATTDDAEAANALAGG